MIYDTKQIVHKIFELPQLKKLSNYRCFDSILENIGQNRGKLIEKVEYKKGYLYFFVKHPTVKMAIQYDLNELKYILSIDNICKYIKDNYKGYFIKINSKLDED